MHNSKKRNFLISAIVIGLIVVMCCLYFLQSPMVLEIGSEFGFVIWNAKVNGHEFALVDIGGDELLFIADWAWRRVPTQWELSLTDADGRNLDDWNRKPSLLNVRGADYAIRIPIRPDYRDAIRLAYSEQSGGGGAGSINGMTKVTEVLIPLLDGAN